MGLNKSITFQMESNDAAINEMLGVFSVAFLTEALGSFTKLYVNGVTYNATYTDVTGAKPPIGIVNPIVRIKSLADAVKGKGFGFGVLAFTTDAKFVYLPSGAPCRLLISTNEDFSVNFLPTIPDQGFSGIMPASFKFNFYCTIFFEIEN